MQKIEFTAEVKFGDSVITSIEVAPLMFMELVDLWAKAARGSDKPEIVLKRERIRHQAHFKAGDERITPDYAQIGTLPIAVAKAINDVLEDGTGAMGEVLNAGNNGVTAPVLFKLGTPFKMSVDKGDDVIIEELEFNAKTLADIEGVLSQDTELNKTAELIRTVATPIGGGNLMRLPGWALDKLTMADGVAIMRNVLPAF